MMRLATSTDVLEDRPTEWPKPPPGFTTKRVLMPWHDFSGKRRRQSHRGENGGRREAKRRRRGDGDGGRRGGRSRDEEYTGEGEHPGLSKGLQSGRSKQRAGFSIEELQAERNAKDAESLM
jgi:hypothetical protein